jgi:AcrR family transcriptional regulator
MYINKSNEGRRSQAERRAATRRALLGAARELFAAEGYSGVSTEELVWRAGVTRGALYHHFEDKRDLFRVLIEEVEDELEKVVMGAARRDLREGRGLWEAYAAGFDAFLDECARPEVGRLLFVDGPSVLGWGEWHEIDARYALAQNEAGLRALIKAGLMEDRPVEPLARLLHGASIEAALYVASSEDSGRAKEEARDAMGRLIGGLRRDPSENER